MAGLPGKKRMDDIGESNSKPTAWQNSSLFAPTCRQKITGAFMASTSRPTGNNLRNDPMPEQIAPAYICPVFAIENTRDTLNP